MIIKFASAFVSSQKNSGNPAAVIVVDAWPDISEMQRIATNFGLSQTAFIKHRVTNHYDIRWFTPLFEAPSIS